MNMSPQNRRTIDCEEVLRRLAEYLDHELGEVGEAEIAKHLDACRSCYSRAEFERGLRARLRELRHEPLDPAFENRICELARGFTIA
jgi:anti-sigma factor (TIGR02949 family)